MAIARLRQLDRRLASDHDTAPEQPSRFGRAPRILAISEALAQHGTYFDTGAPA